MSEFVNDLRARLRTRLGELDQERGRIMAALAELSPKKATPASRKPHKQHVPRGVNRRLILDTLYSNGSMPLSELRERTGIASNTLSSTLHAMKRARRVSRDSRGGWRARG